MSERFYVNCPLAPGAVELPEDESRHLSAVCRARPGDRVYLFNGDGRQYPAEVTQVHRRRVVVQVLGVEAPPRELGFRLEAAVPLPKGDRAQFLVEKLTELGATALVPLVCRHSVVQPRENQREKLRRWVIEASKQCGRNVLLQVQPPADWASYCRRPDLPRLRLLGQPGAPPLEPPAGQDVAIAVGPEGGFTADEVEQARQAGWRLVGLGPRILRVETAAIVLAALAAHSSPSKP